MTAELIEHRAIGAVRLLDATTGLMAGSSLQLEAPGVTIHPNRRGLYVLWSVPGLEAYADAFELPPAAPAIASLPLTLSVSDPAGRYLARRCTVSLPLDPDPSHVLTPQSLFQPIDVQVYPSPAASIAPMWAVVRATVTQSGTATGLAGALLRVVRSSDGTRLALGMSDGRGEALVAIVGIPVTTWDSGPGSVLATEIDATIQAVVDPGAVGIPDPDDLERRRASLHSATMPIKLASGRVLATPLSITLP